MAIVTSPTVPATAEQDPEPRVQVSLPEPSDLNPYVEPPADWQEAELREAWGR